MSGIKKFVKTVFLLLLSATMLFMPLMAYYFFYTTGEMPSPHVRGASFLGSLATYAVFFVFGLVGLRVTLADLPAMAAVTRHFDRVTLRYVLPTLLVFGVVVPLVIGTK